MNSAKIVRDALTAQNYDLLFSTLNSLNLDKDNEHLNELILIAQAQYNRMKGEKNQGLLSFEENNLLSSRLFILILDIAKRLQNLESNESKNNIPYSDDESHSSSIIKFSEIKKYYEINDFQVASYKKVNSYIKKLLSSQIFEDNWENNFLTEFKKKTETLSKIHSAIIKTKFIINKDSPNWYKTNTTTRLYTEKLINKIFNEMEYWEIDEYCNELEKYYNILSTDIDNDNKQTEKFSNNFRGAIYIILTAIGISLYYFWGFKGLGWGVLSFFVLVALSVLIPVFFNRH